MEKWCLELKEYWYKKDIDKIIKLFSKNVTYYETPFEKVKNLKEVWEEIKLQDIKNLEFKVISHNQRKGAVNFILELINGEIYDILYEIELDKDNKCNYFKQWYMSK